MANQVVEPVEEPTLSEVEKDTTFYKRARRHYKEGYKDGLCGIMHSLKDIPPKFRQHYNSGHTLGMYDRGEDVLKPAEVA